MGDETDLQFEDLPVSFAVPIDYSSGHFNTFKSISRSGLHVHALSAPWNDAHLVYESENFKNTFDATAKAAIKSFCGQVDTYDLWVKS